MESILFSLDKVAFAVGGIGVFIVIWGVVVVMVEFVRLEFKNVMGEDVCRSREQIRHHLGQYLLLGFEILIAADVIITVLSPTLEEVYLLALIVAIRTVLVFFLTREMREFH